MNQHDQDRLKKHMQQALPPVDANAKSAHDLWPAMLRRLDEGSGAPMLPDRAAFNWAWFDGALAAALVLLAVSFPAAIPLLLYYL